MSEPNVIDSGDFVIHKPSGDIWRVAYVKDGWLFKSASFRRVNLSDCVLHIKAMKKHRLDELTAIAGMQTATEHVLHARDVLEDEALQKIRDGVSRELERRRAARHE